jgi:hypothetical protein
METAREAIDQAKADFIHAISQLRSAFGNIPDERLDWSPSPAARTPVHIVAHVAQAVQYIQQQMNGIPFRYKTTSEADAAFREWEQQFRTREQALRLLETVSEEYLSWLAGLTPERLEAPAELPFGLGVMPVGKWLTAAPSHTRFHAAQLEYFQTIFGDRDWHL